MCLVTWIAAYCVALLLAVPAFHSDKLFFAFHIIATK